MNPLKNKVISYINEKYSIKADHPFFKFPQYFVFRHLKNQKWFALLMEVPYKKLKIDKLGNTWILNVKNKEDIVDVLRQAKGIQPAYHMNKEKWISILLDGSIDIKEIRHLIDDSYFLTK